MQEQERISIYKDFLKFCYGELSIKQAPRIKITRDKNFVKFNFSFGGYFPQEKAIVVYDNNRNLADCLRTLAHELVHHSQNERGELKKGSGEDGSTHENEANSKAGVILRSYGRQHPIIYERISLGMLMEDLKKYQLYCDMDGVLCDFDAQCQNYFGMSAEDIVEERSLVGLKAKVDESGIEFWSTMPWTETGRSLWERIGKYGVTMLTSPSMFKHAKKGKRVWIANNLNPQPKGIIFAQTGNKHEILKGLSKLEAKKMVLIDDWNENLIPWKNSGGTPIKHTNAKPGIEALEALDKNK